MILRWAIWENRGSARRYICPCQLVSLPSSSRKKSTKVPSAAYNGTMPHPEHGVVADVDIILAHVRLFHCTAGSNKGVIPTTAPVVVTGIQRIWPTPR